jgi:hypothetical protein
MKVVRHPYKLFHRVMPDRVEVLQVQHSARGDDE